MTSSPSQFKPIYAELWQHNIDDWDSVNPMDCYRFKNGYAQLAKGGYWFPYEPITNECPQWHILVNLVKPHVLV